MATYNGELYIERQINSILSQLGMDDELIIIDDYSLDNTKHIIHEFCDKRIKLYANEQNLGFLKTFEKAIILAEGDIIFLSDQDDIWIDKKVETVLYYFKENNIDILFHDAIIVDREQNILFKSFTEIRRISLNPLRNFISNSFTGCCMAFKSDVKKYILPIPEQAGYHDRWIAVIGGLAGLNIKFISDKLIYYVRHGGNASPLKRRNILKILLDRTKLLICIVRHYLF